MKLTTGLLKGVSFLVYLSICPLNMDAQSLCESDCQVQCLGQVNVSLDQTCMAMITPAMGGVGITPDCNSYYSLRLWDTYDNIVPDNKVDISHNGQLMKYEIMEPECGNRCWGNVKVEYKLPPQIDCPPDMTVTCSALAVLDLPPATGGCADYEVSLYREIREPLVCDSFYTQRVTRIYRATDEFGNEDTCSHEVLLERINFDSIVFPEFLTVGNGNAISCNDETIEFDNNGFPLPWPKNPATGSGTGVPILCDSNITDGIFCPLTGSGNGAPLIPEGLDMGETTIPTSVACSAAVIYTDIELPKIGCVRKIMRTWEVREWWCNSENTRTDLQLIEIVDDEAPEFVCPADFTVSTNYECAGDVDMPSVAAIDECDNGINVIIDYPNGILMANGGPVDLDLGMNTVEYVVSDNCYNSSNCFVNVTVEDNTNPVAICEQYKVISLGQAGNTIVFAEPFDNGSWDECALDRFEVRRMDTTCVASDTLFGESVNFCCADVGEEVMVVFRAWDVAGNYNDCMISVEVQDKSIPSITCPDDVTIDCRDAYDLNNLSLTFGDIVSADNCGLDRAEETVIDDINQCGIGTITRVFEIRDEFGNVLRQCKQLVTITNNTPFVESNIIWPLDYELEGGCTLDDLSPANLPEPYSFPIFGAGDDECSLLGYDYEDQVFQSIPGSGECAHIERTWRVINWCSQVEGTFDIFEIPSPQIIKLNNSVSPVMEDQEDLVFESQNVDCENSNVSVERTATDDCQNPLFWSFVVRNESGALVTTGNSNVYVDTLQTGNYTIEWTVTDGCANFDFDIQNIEVLNTKAPSPVCINGLAANLVLMDLDSNGVFDAEMVELWASDFDASSYHSCGNPITFSFSPDPDDKRRVYDCDDIGINVVQMYVTDVFTGAQDYCETFVEIQDNNGDNVCEPDTSGRAVIAGDIYTEYNATIENVQLTAGIPDLEVLTDGNGTYAFDAMPMGGSYLITPEKDTDHLKGISTLDLILIQRHILGVDYLDSPYQLIAADVNNSEDISVLDLIELRKLILGVYNELPDNKSWRFVDAEYSFADPYNPWLADLPEDYEIIKLDSDMDIDFIGVKIGDINGSAENNLSEHEEEAFRFDVSVDAHNPGDIAHIYVNAADYGSLSGWQTTMQFDPERIEILEISGMALTEWSGDNYYIHPHIPGRITMSYSGDFDDQRGSLFVVKARILKVGSGNPISFGSDVLKSQAYTRDARILSLGTDRSEENISKTGILAVSPNPWIERTSIDFYLDKSEKVSWRFYDVNGRQIYYTSGVYTTGKNTLKVHRNQLSATGVVYVQMITSDGIIDYKMLVL